MDLEKNASKINNILISIVLQFAKYFTGETVRLSISEMLIIEYIGLNESATMTELASILSQPLTTMTSTVSRLVKYGLLERHRIESDRRVVLVSFSNQGKEYHFQHKEEHIQGVMGFLLALTEEEQQSLISILERINKMVLENSPSL